MRIPLSLVLLALLLAGCVGAGEAPQLTPTPTDAPWSPPNGAITLATVEQIRLLGSNHAAGGTVFAPDFSTDGRYLLARSGADQAVWLWDVQVGRALWSLNNIDAAHVFLMGDPVQAAVVQQDGDVLLYDLADGSAGRDFRASREALSAAARSADGRLLALGGVEGRMVLWDMIAARRDKVIDGHETRVLTLAFSPAASLLASVGNDRAVRLWDVASGELRAEWTGLTDFVYGVAFSQDGTLLAWHTDVDIRVFATQDGAPVRTIETPELAARYAILFTPSNDILAAGVADAVTLWSVDTGAALAEMPGHLDHFAAMALNPAGDLLVTVTQPGPVFLWNMADPNRRFQLAEEDDAIVSASWSPDGQVIVLAAADGALYFWGVPGDSNP